MSMPSPPSTLTGGCLCDSIRYTITIPDAASWPPYCSSCQCTRCRKWLSSLQPIALTIPLANLSLPDPSSKDASQLKVFESSRDCERAFCGKCGSGLTFRHKIDMPTTTELWIGTLDEEVLIGVPEPDQSGKEARGEKVERSGGWGKQLAHVKETLFWGHAIEGVTDEGPAARGKKWWGMIHTGESFV